MTTPVTKRGAVPSDCAAPFGPWNPGLLSQIPRRLLPLTTIYRPENSYTDVARAQELADLTGLPPLELVVFRPERLALHAALVRVMADFSVPDGSTIGDLGINFREIVRVILARYVEPQMEMIGAAYAAARGELATIVDAELDALFPPGAGGAGGKSPSPPRWGLGFLARLLPSAPEPAPAVPPERALIARWQSRERGAPGSPQRAACAALARVVSALLVRHGELWGGRELISSVAIGIAANDYGDEAVGRAIEPLLARAVAEVPFRLLPRQAQPVVMNTKGASASGKSTMRPLQKRLAGSIGVDWLDFALISPDIWRKQLLEYESLGADYKYGGAFTGDEVQIIDQKLDGYMARKGARGEMPHLLIDRFRFDSFAAHSDEAGSNLLTRFGHFIYMFFMITPPGSLVERAWNRGLEFGRYKSVDDILAHGVEAYAGMPELFFTWANRADKRVHFEFLDNSVRQGERPRTAAFGWNGELNVLDVKSMLDVERFRRVNVDARTPAELYPDPAMLAPARNAGFLRECVARIPAVNFADQATGRVYLRIVAGAPAWVDRDALAAAAENADAREGLAAVVPGLFDGSHPAPDAPCYVHTMAGPDGMQTLGAWGELA